MFISLRPGCAGNGGEKMAPLYISSVKGDETVLEEGGLQPSSFHPANGEERKSSNSDYCA